MKYKIFEEVDLEKLDGEDSHLLDILIQCEAIVDDLDLYTAENWIDGEIVRGPIVRRHWVSIDLLYKSMPDPRMALRLLKHGVQVEFNKVKQEQKGDVTTPDSEPANPTHWLVTITIPKRLLDTTKEAELDTYDDEVDTDDVQTAKDVGLDDESSYKQAEQAPNGMQQPNPTQPLPTQ